jgi:hypothetical protein
MIRNDSERSFFTRASFFPAMYHTHNNTAFHTPAQIAVKAINFQKFILNIHAGIDISCLTAGINLPIRVVIDPCCSKYSSDFV